ncbi:response regulator [Shewanella sp. GXUN23E]|uniref:response regulator n=1 Tax=Shewanella sp. GXUN23E TaxID=3422498 RepID=UPI003D7E69EB
MRILVIEDNHMLAEAICQGLRQQGMQADSVDTCARAELALPGESWSAMVLDLGLPDGNGVALLKRWRKQGLDIPVIILTANTDFDTKLICLDTGADDYLGKPFDVRELAARLRAVVRRHYGRHHNQLCVGPLTLNLDTCDVTFRAEPVQLSRREYQLLLELAQSAGRVLSRQQLEQLTYGWEEVGSNSVEVHIHHLRKKTANELVKTVRGIGYALVELTD